MQAERLLVPGPADGPALDPDMLKGVRIAVLLPCYNEERTIAATIRAFNQALPGAEVYVFDNNSRDGTVTEAIGARAIVRRETLQGKGNVVRRMFADVDADVYVMADGDNTYDAAQAPQLIRRLLDDHLDMVVGSRAPTEDPAAYRRGHKFGNRMLTGCVARIFGNRFHDMLSGYRVFSRRFVKSFPALSSGFETETELTVHALQLKMPCAEIQTAYGARPEGSTSKLATYRDGFRILRTIILLFKEEKPLQFFSLIFAGFFLVSLALAGPVFVEYAQTGLVPRLPTAVLSASTMLLGFLSLACGMILDTVARGRREAKRLHYLNLAPRAAR
ncbi:glycosyltransferase family 2 protein [Zavarzinia sp. CC-PAN008]|uniref:glycosyltransferase family 2 protein n=1 Tax=Zavarzinia sp. CC-PAN008 TaxID=3243332 RepID=UPI003F744633